MFGLISYCTMKVYLLTILWSLCCHGVLSRSLPRADNTMQQTICADGNPCASTKASLLVPNSNSNDPWGPRKGFNKTISFEIHVRVDRFNLNDKLLKKINSLFSQNTSQNTFSLVQSSTMLASVLTGSFTQDPIEYESNKPAAYVVPKEMGIKIPLEVPFDGPEIDGNGLQSVSSSTSFPTQNTTTINTSKAYVFYQR